MLNRDRPASPASGAGFLLHAWAGRTTSPRGTGMDGPPGLPYIVSERKERQVIRILIIAAALVIACVIFHGMTLQILGRWLFRFRKDHFWLISLLIFAVILAHLVEILFFALAYEWLVPHPDFGSLAGIEDPGRDDLYYFSAVTFTATGYGDLIPVGHLRLLAMIEALTGLIMIAWTASFAFLIMQRYWRNRQQLADLPGSDNNTSH
jgi:hypothetical protein